MGEIIDKSWISDGYVPDVLASWMDSPAIMRRQHVAGEHKSFVMTLELLRVNHHYSSLTTTLPIMKTDPQP